MADKVMTLSKKNLREVVAWLETTLRAEKLPRKEIFIARLLVEENFLQMGRLSGSDDFSLRIEVKKWFGDVNIELCAPGEPYLPLTHFVKMNTDEENYSSLSILYEYRNRLKFQREKGHNVAIIKAHVSESKRTQRTMAGLVAGVVLGLLLKNIVTDPVDLAWIEDNILNSIQTMFLHALIMVATPMIFFSILSGFANISDTTSFGRIGKRITLISLPKLAFYVALGLFVGDALGSIAQIPAMIAGDAAVPDTGTPLRDLIVGIIPGNIVTPFYTNNVMQMLLIACVSGIMLARAGHWTFWAMDGINFFNRFFMELLELIMPFVPLVVMVSMVKLTMDTGLESLLPYVSILFWAALGIPITLIVSGLLVFFIGRITPWPFLRKAARFIILPFSLSDSTACMPSTFDFCRNKLGMDEKFTKFSVPVGMQLNMDGTAYYVAIVSMMLAHTFGIETDTEFCLSFFFAQCVLALTGIGFLAMPSIYAAFGIPYVAIAMVIGIEPILDMFGTAQSVIGNVTSSFVVCRGEGGVDEKIYLGDGYALEEKSGK